MQTVSEAIRDFLEKIPVTPAKDLAAAKTAMILGCFRWFLLSTRI